MLTFLLSLPKLNEKVSTPESKTSSVKTLRSLDGHDRTAYSNGQIGAYSKPRSVFRPCRPLTVRDCSALSDLDNVSVRIADVATYLAVLRDRFRDELGPSTFP